MLLDFCLHVISLVRSSWLPQACVLAVADKHVPACSNKLVHPFDFVIYNKLGEIFLATAGGFFGIE